MKARPRPAEAMDTAMAAVMLPLMIRQGSLSRLNRSRPMLPRMVSWSLRMKPNDAKTGRYRPSSLESRFYQDLSRRREGRSSMMERVFHANGEKVKKRKAGRPR